MAIIKILQTVNAEEGVEKREPSCTMWKDMVTVENSTENALKKRKKKKTTIPTVPLLSI